jgi:hypothetical protein
MIAALPVDNQGELFSHHVDNDLADQKTDDPLARLDAHSRAVPGPRQVRTQCEQAFSSFGPKKVAWLCRNLGELILEHSHAGESFVPPPLQFAGDEPVLGIGGVVLTMRAAGFEPCLLKGILDLAAFLLLLLSLCFKGRQRSLNPERLQTVQDFLCDGTIDPHTSEGNAARDSHGVERAATDVALCGATFAAVGDIKLASAARAAKEAW